MESTREQPAVGPNMWQRFWTYLKRNRLPYILITPSLIMIALIYFYPVLRGFWDSLHYYSRLQPDQYRWVGLNNYITALKNPEFWMSLRVSLVWVVCGVGFSYIIGLIAALILNEEFKGRGLIRSLLLLPWVIPPVVAGSSWRWMFADRDGIINLVLRGLGVISKPIYWLAKPNLAMVSVIIVYVWGRFPFMMMTLLSALSSISDEIYEAGRIDGASSWQLFRYITLPLIMPVSVISTVLASIWAFNDFGVIFTLTGGGPAKATMTLIIRAYNEAFPRFNVGMGSTLAFISMIIMLSVGAVYLKLQAQAQDMY